MMTQDLKHQSRHPANLWGKQIRHSPLACNPFERPTPFEHINFKNMPNNGHDNELAQWNIHLGFSF